MDARFQPILKRMETDLEALLADLNSYPSDLLRKRPSPEAWSVLEIMQHLMVSESRSLGYVKKKTSYPDALKKAGLLARLRTAGLRFFLWMPLKFKAPAIVNQDHFHENANLQDLSASWRTSRGELSHFLENIQPDWVEKEIYRHALAGRMTISGMLAFFSEHFIRHRRQIYRTLEIVSASD